MANFYVYSFEDVSVTFNHPDLGTYLAFGTGIGTLNIAWTNDMSSHETAADGAVVVNKSVKKNGTVNFEILQSSDFNTYLKRFANYVTSTPSTTWAAATVVVKSRTTGETFTCTGVSLTKPADVSFQSQVQYRTWGFMAANIDMT